jgi:hypothetical protein
MGQLEVRNFQAADAGDYEIQAYDSSGRLISRAQIRLSVSAAVVTGNPAPQGLSYSVTIIQGPELQIQPGGNAIISTSQLGSQVDHVRWFRLPGLIPVNPTWVQNVMGRLEIVNFQPGDAGDYEIQLYDRRGALLGRAKIRLLVLGYGPAIGGGSSVSTSGIQIVQLAQGFELECDSTNPDAVLRWFRVEADGDRLTTPRGHDDGQGILTTARAQMDDSGEYRCLSYRGNVQVASKSIYVIVQSRNPVFQSFVLGIEAELECPILAVPGMKVTWSKDAGPVPPGAIEEGRILRIPNFSSDHEGRYECKVEVQQEFAFGYIQVTVREGDVLYVEIRSTHSVVAIGETVSFTCSVNGDPHARIEWSKANGPLPPSASVQGNQLTINVHSQSDGGIYRCTAFARGNTRLASEAILSVGSRGSIRVMPIRKFALLRKMA